MSGPVSDDSLPDMFLLYRTSVRMSSDMQRIFQKDLSPTAAANPPENATRRPLQEQATARSQQSNPSPAHGRAAGPTRNRSATHRPLRGQATPSRVESPRPVTVSDTSLDTRRGRRHNERKRRRPVAEPWSIHPAGVLLAKGNPPSRLSISQAISQHRVAGDEGVMRRLVDDQAR